MSYYQHATSSKSWDPWSVLQFENPQLGYRTCVGTAVTYGRRCKRSVAMSSPCLATLETLGPLQAAKSSMLRDIAGAGLCWQHKHQVDDVVARWRDVLHRFAEAQSSGRKGSSTRHDSKPSAARPRPTPMTEQTQPNIDDLMEQIRRLQEELERLRSQKPSPYSSTGSTASGQQSHTEERRRQEENDKKAKVAKEAKAAKEAKKAKEAREEQEREQSVWLDAWTRYDEGWDKIIAAGGSVERSGIPWPTKSGKRTTINEEVVREFFRRNPSVLLSSDKGEERFRLMSRETKRWHPDKLQCRFGREMLIGEYKADIDFISKLIVRLWKEAKMKREEV